MAWKASFDDTPWIDSLDGDSPLEVSIDHDGPTKLYIAITENNWNVASSIAKLNSIEARTWISQNTYSVEKDRHTLLFRFLPLHSACARKPTADFIRTLLASYPQAAREVDDQGMIPLHYACANGAGAEICKLLIEYFPGGPAVKEVRDSKLPLHNLCQWGGDRENVLESLLVHLFCCRVHNFDLLIMTKIHLIDLI